MKKIIRKISILKNVLLSFFKRTTPTSRKFGLDRGMPIDRYYIETFLEKNKSSINGTVIEVGDDRYTKKFGTNVEKSIILKNDLTQKESLLADSADCFVVTQTLNFIYDVKKAIEGIYLILKPGGVALITIAGISQISRYDMDRWGDYWRFTTLSTQKIFEEVFSRDNVAVDFYGNCLAAKSFLDGLSAREIGRSKLDHKDSDYQLLITVVAKKNV